jgi:hypothetical protein
MGTEKPPGAICRTCVEGSHRAHEAWCVKGNTLKDNKREQENKKGCEAFATFLRPVADRPHRPSAAAALDAATATTPVPVEATARCTVRCKKTCRDKTWRESNRDYRNHKVLHDGTGTNKVCGELECYA